MPSLVAPNRFGLEIDSTGIKERCFLNERFWSWAEIKSIQLVDVDGSKVVGLTLDKETWQRKWRINVYDATLLNEYAVPHSVILVHLLECQQKSQWPRKAADSELD